MSRAFFFLCALALSLGCGDDDRPVSDAGGTTDAGVDAAVEPPPERCASFTDPGIRFRDATSYWGLEGVLANRVSVTDLNGDGYADIVAHRVGSHNRADFTQPASEWPYRVLVNDADFEGNRSFVDRTVESGYGTLRDPAGDAGRAAHFAVFGDVDNDGDLDAFSGTYADATMPETDPGDRSEILLNEDGVFTLAPRSEAIAGSADGSRPMPTSSAAFLDHDRDGVLDVFIGYWYAMYGSSLWGMQDRLVRGTGAGSFEDITDAQGLATIGSPGARNASRPTYGVTACDIDLDGDTDLLASAYGRQWNQLWLRGEDGYTDIGETSGFAGDENVDYSDNEFYRCYCQTTGSCTADPPRIACSGVYWNAGLDDQPFRLNGNTFTTACADVDADGDQDLYSAEIVHWHIGQSSDSAELLRNDPVDGAPRFTRPGNAASGLSVPRVGVSWNEGGIASAFADLDNDGRLDVLLGTSDYPDQRLWIYRQKADGTFEEVSEAAGLVHACAPSFSLADLDRDGDLDLLVASSTARDCADAWPDGPALRAYENVSGQDASWTRIHLVGGEGINASAIGAVVRVTAGGTTQTREVQGGYGHFGMQHDLDVFVGLGGECSIDSIEVRWPDAAGTVQTFETGLRARYPIEISAASGLTYPAAP